MWTVDFYMKKRIFPYFIALFLVLFSVEVQLTISFQIVFSISFNSTFEICANFDLVFFLHMLSLIRTDLIFNPS